MPRKKTTRKKKLTLFEKLLVKIIVDALHKTFAVELFNPPQVLPPGVMRCTIADKRTGGEYYCTREAGHKGPCAAKKNARPCNPDTGKRFDDPCCNCGHKQSSHRPQGCGATDAAGDTCGCVEYKRRIMSKKDKRVGKKLDSLPNWGR